MGNGNQGDRSFAMERALEMEREQQEGRGKGSKQN